MFTEHVPRGNASNVLVNTCNLIVIIVGGRRYGEKEPSSCPMIMMMMFECLTAIVSVKIF